MKAIYNFSEKDKKWYLFHFLLSLSLIIDSVFINSLFLFTYMSDNFLLIVSLRLHFLVTSPHVLQYCSFNFSSILAATRWAK